MNSEASGGEILPEACVFQEGCPLCGRPNQCRLESGEAYKGRCWCERLIVPGSTLRRLLGDSLSPRCLCPDCLEAIAANPDLSVEDLARKRANHSPESLAPGDGDFYWEGDAMVFTAQYHLRRGSCCGSGCRHCPYGE